MPSFSLITFGCQMNQHDSDRMVEVLRQSGFVQHDDLERADLVLLNTCSVREKAEQKLRSEVGRLGLIKRRRPELLIGVAGCVAQQEGERLLQKLPQIDLVVGPDNIAELPGLLADAQSGGPPQVRTVFDLDSPRFLRAEPDPSRHTPTAYVTIMKGCDERCTFCVVPYTRGPERYRPSEDIVDEVARLVSAGTKEITLLGQTVNSYTDPTGMLEGDSGAEDSGSQFAALLRRIADSAPRLARLRYTSPHPRHLTPALVRAHQELPVLVRHVHMPVQSGSNRLLKRMLRRYTVEQYEERIHALQSSVPGLTLSTDIIVGFPGETAEDFEKTCELVSRIGFVGVFGFKYSVRPHTPALKLKDDVSEAEKSERLARLFEIAERIRSTHLSSLVGSEQEILVEGYDKRGLLVGRTERNEIVHLNASPHVIGELMQVRIAEAYKHSLRAEPLDARLRGQPQPPAPQVRSLPVV